MGWGGGEGMKVGGEGWGRREGGRGGEGRGGMKSRERYHVSK